MLALKQFSRRLPSHLARTTRISSIRSAPRTAQRSYASASDHAPKGSEIPWIAGAVVATVGGVWWALSPSPGGAHHDDDHGHDEHAAPHGDQDVKTEKKGDDSEDDKSVEDDKSDGIDKDEKSKDSSTDEDDNSTEEKEKPQGTDKGTEGEKHDSGKANITKTQTGNRTGKSDQPGDKDKPKDLKDVPKHKGEEGKKS